MSPRSSSPRKPKGPPPAPDVYVGLLFVAVACLCVGCILLYLEANAYEFSLPGGV
jgi:hypothetical protein